MSAEDLSKMYQQDFRAALECLEEGDNDEAILAANQALMDLNLPPYWQVQACILIACLEDDWDEAELFRLVAEDVWKQANTLYPPDDLNARDFLVKLRDALDDLARSQQADFSPAQANSNEDDESEEQDCMDGIESDNDDANEQAVMDTSPDHNYKLRSLIAVRAMYKTIDRREAIIRAQDVTKIVKAGAEAADVVPAAIGIGVATDPEPTPSKTANSIRGHQGISSNDTGVVIGFVSPTRIGADSGIPSRPKSNSACPEESAPPNNTVTSCTETSYNTLPPAKDTLNRIEVDYNVNAYVDKP